MTLPLALLHMSSLSCHLSFWNEPRSKRGRERSMRKEWPGGLGSRERGPRNPSPGETRISPFPYPSETRVGLDLSPSSHQRDWDYEFIVPLIYGWRGKQGCWTRPLELSPLSWNRFNMGKATNQDQFNYQGQVYTTPT